MINSTSSTYFCISKINTREILNTFKRHIQTYVLRLNSSLSSLRRIQSKTRAKSILITTWRISKFMLCKNMKSFMKERPLQTGVQTQRTKGKERKIGRRKVHYNLNNLSYQAFRLKTNNKFSNKLQWGKIKTRTFSICNNHTTRQANSNSTIISKWITNPNQSLKVKRREIRKRETKKTR